MRIWGFSSLFSAIAMFSCPPTNVLKILHRCENQENNQKCCSAPPQFFCDLSVIFLRFFCNCSCVFLVISAAKLVILHSDLKCSGFPAIAIFFGTPSSFPARTSHTALLKGWRLTPQLRVTRSIYITGIILRELISALLYILFTANIFRLK